MLQRSLWRLSGAGAGATTHATPPTPDTMVVPAPTNAGTVVPVFEGSGDYLRNTSLRKPIPGYSRRWKWYAGHVINEAAFPFAEGKQELCRGSWFAVPNIGRHVPGTPSFHIVTANHVIHPFWYPDLFDMTSGSEVELIKYYSEHDVACTLKTAGSKGEDSHRAFKTRTDMTYAHEKRHLDVCVLHPSVDECEMALSEVYAHLRATGSSRRSARALLTPEEIEAFEETHDSRQFPFHFQLLAFDCRPLREGEKVMIHGHRLDEHPQALTPPMQPIVVRATVKKIVSQDYVLKQRRGAEGAETTRGSDPFTQQESMIVVEPEQELPHGVCGGPVLRDGRVVGMVVASITKEDSEFEGCGLVVSATGIRDHLLRVEESWRYPAAPSTNWLKANGYLPVGQTAATPQITAGAEEPKRLTTGAAAGGDDALVATPSENAGAAAPVAVVEKPVFETGRVREVIPERYQMPSFLPRPTSSANMREYIKAKFTDPLPEDYAPPQLPPSHPEHIKIPVSRDRTNPYGELPPDSGMNIPSLPLFAGYSAKRGVEAHTDDTDLPGWVLKYGSAENYYRAHGIDPARAPPEDLKYFKNYISPRDKPGKGWGLYEDRTESTAELHIQLTATQKRDLGLLDDKAEGQLRIAEGRDAAADVSGQQDGGMDSLTDAVDAQRVGAAAADAPSEVLTTKKMEKMGGMDRFFGQEEYVQSKEDRRRSTLQYLADKRTAAIEGGDTQKAAAYEAKAREFVEREQELDWHRGDTPYVSATQEQLLMLEHEDSGETEEEDVAMLPVDDDGDGDDQTAVEASPSASSDADPHEISPATARVSFASTTRVARTAPVAEAEEDVSTPPPPRSTPTPTPTQQAPPSAQRLTANAMGNTPFQYQRDVAWKQPTFPSEDDATTPAAPTAPLPDADGEEHDPLGMEDMSTMDNFDAERAVQRHEGMNRRAMGLRARSPTEAAELAESLGGKLNKPDRDHFSGDESSFAQGGYARPSATLRAAQLQQAQLARQREQQARLNQQQQHGGGGGGGCGGGGCGGGGCHS